MSLSLIIDLARISFKRQISRTKFSILCNASQQPWPLIVHKRVTGWVPGTKLTGFVPFYSSSAKQFPQQSVRNTYAQAPLRMPVYI